MAKIAPSGPLWRLAAHPPGMKFQKTQHGTIPKSPNSAEHVAKLALHKEFFRAMAGEGEKLRVEKGSRGLVLTPIFASLWNVILTTDLLKSEKK